MSESKKRKPVPGAVALAEDALDAVTGGAPGFLGGVSVAAGDLSGDGATAKTLGSSTPGSPPPTGTVTFLVDGNHS